MTRRLSPWETGRIGRAFPEGNGVGLISGPGDWILAGLGSYGLSGVDN